MVRYVWLVYYQKETHYGFPRGCIPLPRWGNRFIDRVVVGVYDTKEAADIAAYEYYTDVLDHHSDNDAYDDGECAGCFCDAHGAGRDVASERVFVSRRIVNPQGSAVPINYEELLG